MGLWGWFFFPLWRSTFPFGLTVCLQSFSIFLIQSCIILIPLPHCVALPPLWRSCKEHILVPFILQSSVKHQVLNMRSGSRNRPCSPVDSDRDPQSPDSLGVQMSVFPAWNMWNNWAYAVFRSRNANPFCDEIPPFWPLIGWSLLLCLGPYLSSYSKRAPLPRVQNLACWYQYIFLNLLHR